MDFSPWILIFILVFCRIGGFLMLAPGFSTLRVAVHIRLFFALSVTACLFPLILPKVSWDLFSKGASGIVFALISEVGIGIFFGLFARLFFSALEFSTVSIAAFLGLPALPELSATQQDPVPALANLMLLSAVTLLMMGDYPLLALQSLYGSYDHFPLGSPIQIPPNFRAFMEHLQMVFLMAITLSAPFLIYGFLANFAVGVMNKLVPQIPIYFIATPFVLAGGLFLLYHVLPHFLTAFLSHFTLFP